MDTSNTNDYPDHTDVLQRLCTSWGTRVAVKQPDLDSTYDLQKPDYPEHLLPFKTHPSYENLDDATKQRVLAGGWIAYNEKTIAVEESIINPACALLMHQTFPGTSAEWAPIAMAQTMVDEQYHILMCLNACRLSRRQRKLDGLQLPMPGIVSLQRTYLEGATAEWQQPIVQLAFATIAEMTINAYLLLLSSDTTIQPLHRITTDLHRRDEAAHHALFRQIVKSVFLGMNQHQQNYFVEILPHGLRAFASAEFHGWRALLEALGIKDAAMIIEDCKDLPANSALVRDYGGLKGLATELGILDRIDYVL